MYFSSASENTHRFVDDGVPLRSFHYVTAKGAFEARTVRPDPPTYGAAPDVDGTRHELVPSGHPIPQQRAQSRPHPRGDCCRQHELRRVYCYAGNVIHRRSGPVLYRFELMGTAEDVVAVREGLAQFMESEHGTDHHRFSPAGSVERAAATRRVGGRGGLPRAQRDAETCTVRAARSSSTRIVRAASSTSCSTSTRTRSFHNLDGSSTTWSGRTTTSVSPRPVLAQRREGARPGYAKKFRFPRSSVPQVLHVVHPQDVRR